MRDSTQQHFDGAVRLIGHAIQRAREAGVPVDDRHWNRVRAVVAPNGYLLTLQSGSHVVRRSFSFAHGSHRNGPALTAATDQSLNDMIDTLKVLRDRSAHDARPGEDSPNAYIATKSC